MGKFRTWFESGAATTAMHGGLNPFDLGNTTLNIRSKTQTQNGRAGHMDDGEGPTNTPEKTFGFRSPSERKEMAKSRLNPIHKKKGDILTRNNVPDIVY